MKASIKHLLVTLIFLLGGQLILMHNPFCEVE